MPKPGRGRPPGSLKRTSPFNIDRFRSILTQIGGNPSAWSLKVQWRDFYKLYFKTTRIRNENVKIAYSFFRAHQDNLLHTNHDPKNDLPIPIHNASKITAVNSLPSFSQIHDPGTDYAETHSSAAVLESNQTANDHVLHYSRNFPKTQMENEWAQFPSLENVNNSVFLINCTNISLNTDISEKEKIYPSCNVEAFHGKDANTSTKAPETPCAGLSPYVENDYNLVQEEAVASSSISQENQIWKDNHTVFSQTTAVGNDSILRNSPKTIRPKNMSNRETNITDTSETTNFTIPKIMSVPFNKNTWEGLFSRRKQNKSGEQVLPPDWCDTVASILAEALPYCSVAFKRHKLLKAKSQHHAKFWYYCRIAGCDLKGTAILNSSFFLDVENEITHLKHDKGMPNSFQSRPIKGDNRMVLGERAADMKYPSKLLHRKVSALDENLFQMGNMKDIPRSRNVITQCSYEYRKSKRQDDALMCSLMLLKEEFIKKMVYNKTVPGFIQFLSVDPFTIGLWCEQDIVFFHEMAKSHSLLVDATGSISTKLHGKEILYFSFLCYDRSVKTEPVPHLEILTTHPSTTTLSYLLSLYLENEKKRFGYVSHSVPILCTTDCSWPILKCLVECFNSESLQDYMLRSYKIASGNAEENDLSVTMVKTVIHISLCHSMKAFSRKINDIFKEENKQLKNDIRRTKADKNFIKFAMSLLANSGNLKDIFEIMKALFSVLLSKSKQSCIAEKDFLQSKMDKIEKFKEDTLLATSSFKNEKEECFEDLHLKELPRKEETYLQQSKKSIYYKKCLDIYKQCVKVTESKHVGVDIDDKDDCNPLYSPRYAEYICNNWCGLLPLWTSLHLGDNGRHGNSDIYLRWSDKFQSIDCVINPPRTQGIVEFHQFSAKHISMNSRRERVDDVVKNLHLAKISKRRLFQVAKSRRKATGDKIKDTLPNKIATEKWKKKKLSQGPGFFQKNRKVTTKTKKENWENLSVIPWGGEYHRNDAHTIRMINTCTIDCLLQILLTFYSLNIDQMQRLFLSDDSVSQTLSVVVQHLLTSDFSSAKYIWLSELCNLSPDSKNLINAYEDDKMISLYPLRFIFKRKYDISTCSSKYCPLSENDNNVEIYSTTLHYPDVECESLLDQSLREFEHGISSKDMISCKAQFDQQPDHDQYISESNNGQDIIRCVGWQNPVGLTFIKKPPFLLFELSSLFSIDITDLSMIPKDIYVYNDHYRFGGATSHVSSRSHYVGYVYLDDGKCLLYDGLPTINPVLRHYPKNVLYGELSLLVYFPVEAGVNVGASTPKIDSRASCSMKNACKNEQDEQKDAMLAQALHDLEKQEYTENIYSKPRGKSYRKISQSHVKSLVISIDLKKIQLKTPLDDVPSNLTKLKIEKTSVPSLSSEDESEVDTELIEFINSSKEMISSLISDDENILHQARSERAFAIRHLPSRKKLMENAENDYLKVTDFMGPLTSYSQHIFSKFLTYKSSLFDSESEDYNPNYGGYWPLEVKIRPGLSMYQVLQFLITPELITEFIMRSYKINYKLASVKLYSGSLPTAHHIDILSCKNVIFDTAVNNITLQCVLGDLAQQWTHGILNSTDRNLTHSNSIAKSIKFHGGISVDSTCRLYVKAHGPLDLGDVKALSAGELRCFFLFHGASVNKCSSEEISLNGTLANALKQADEKQCQSLSIPLYKYQDLSDFQALQESTVHLKSIKVVRIVSTDKDRLEGFIQAAQSSL